MSCAIEGCTSHTGRKENAQGPLSFHSFPKDEETKQKWLLHARKRNWTWKSHCHVCSIHFTPDSFIPNGKFKWRRLKADAFPTLYLSDTDSLLGTQSYWQQAYSKDISNFDQNGDPGDVWFGEDSAYRVVDWLSKHVEDKSTAIIDLGCGNGYSLSELARQGFVRLLGVDYCQEAITLAEKVSKREFPIIEFKVFDITEHSVSRLGSFGVVHDKGTYDAISLHPENSKERRQKYLDQVAAMLEPTGVFVITSCNWTEEELVSQFSSRLTARCIIPSPQFKFGGKVGSVVSSVVFEHSNK